MDTRQMISLKVVVDVRFPVALHVISAPLEEFHFAEGKLLYLHGQLTQTLAQRPRIGIEIHKHKVEPFVDSHWRKRKVLRTKVLYAFDLGRTDQSAVETVGPTVVSAAKQLARAAALGRRTRTMPANVEETPQLSIESADTQQRLT